MFTICIALAHEKWYISQIHKNHSFNPFKPNRIPRSYQLDEFIFVLMVVGGIFFIRIETLIEDFVSKQWRP